MIKQELEISDVELDEESQSNYDINYIDDDSYIDGPADVPFIQKTFDQAESLVYDRPKVFECYLCHKQWPTVGKRFLVKFLRIAN